MQFITQRFQTLSDGNFIDNLNFDEEVFLQIISIFTFFLIQKIIFKFLRKIRLILRTGLNFFRFKTF